jgi:hypothetical protein
MPLPAQGNINAEENQIYIHAPNGIRTQDPSVRAREDISCPRPRGRCDRQSATIIRPFCEKFLSVARPTKIKLTYISWKVGIWFEYENGTVFGYPTHSLN